MNIFEKTWTLVKDDVRLVYRVVRNPFTREVFVYRERHEARGDGWRLVSSQPLLLQEARYDYNACIDRYGWRAL